MRIHHIVTDLCVMDFGGPDHAIRVISLHPGVSFEQVQAATGFPLLKADDLREPTHPTDEQMAVIRKDRKSGVYGRSGIVSFKLGGRRILKKNKIKENKARE